MKIWVYISHTHTYCVLCMYVCHTHTFVFVPQESQALLLGLLACLDEFGLVQFGLVQLSCTAREPGAFARAVSLFSLVQFSLVQFGLVQFICTAVCFSLAVPQESQTLLLELVVHHLSCLFTSLAVLQAPISEFNVQFSVVQCNLVCVCFQILFTPFVIFQAPITPFISQFNVQFSLVLFGVECVFSNTFHSPRGLLGPYQSVHRSIQCSLVQCVCVFCLLFIQDSPRYSLGT